VEADGERGDLGGEVDGGGDGSEGRDGRRAEGEGEREGGEREARVVVRLSACAGGHGWCDAGVRGGGGSLWMRE
jgi:hypothetical protein